MSKEKIEGQVPGAKSKKKILLVLLGSLVITAVASIFVVNGIKEKKTEVAIVDYLKSNEEIKSFGKVSCLKASDMVCSIGTLEFTDKDAVEDSLTIRKAIITNPENFLATKALLTYGSKSNGYIGSYGLSLRGIVMNNQTFYERMVKEQIKRGRALPDSLLALLKENIDGSVNFSLVEKSTIGKGGIVRLKELIRLDLGKASIVLDSAFAVDKSKITEVEVTPGVIVDTFRMAIVNKDKKFISKVVDLAILDSKKSHPGAPELDPEKLKLKISQDLVIAIADSKVISMENAKVLSKKVGFIISGKTSDISLELVNLTGETLNKSVMSFGGAYMFQRLDSLSKKYKFIVK